MKIICYKDDIKDEFSGIVLQGLVVFILNNLCDFSIIWNRLMMVELSTKLNKCFEEVNVNGTSIFEDFYFGETDVGELNDLLKDKRISISEEEDRFLLESL